MRAQGSLDSFGTILSSLAKRLGLHSHLFELHLQQQWRETVGEPIGSHTWPAQIRFKKLFLIVRNSVWLQQLTFLKPTLLAKLNQQAGSDCITDIAFRVGEIPTASGASDRSLTPPPQPLPEAALPVELSSHLTAIQDPAIRQRLIEVIGMYPSRTPPRPEADP